MILRWLESQAFVAFFLLFFALLRSYYKCGKPAHLQTNKNLVLWTTVIKTHSVKYVSYKVLCYLYLYSLCENMLQCFFWLILKHLFKVLWYSLGCLECSIYTLITVRFSISSIRYKQEYLPIPCGVILK